MLDSYSNYKNINKLSAELDNNQKTPFGPTSTNIISPFGSANNTMPLDSSDSDDELMEDILRTKMKGVNLDLDEGDKGLSVNYYFDQSVNYLNSQKKDIEPNFPITESLHEESIISNAPKSSSFLSLANESNVPIDLLFSECSTNLTSNGLGSGLNRSFSKPLTENLLDTPSLAFNTDASSIHANVGVRNFPLTRNNLGMKGCLDVSPKHNTSKLIDSSMSSSSIPLPESNAKLNESSLHHVTQPPLVSGISMLMQHNKNNLLTNSNIQHNIPLSKHPLTLGKKTHLKSPESCVQSSLQSELSLGQLNSGPNASQTFGFKSQYTSPYAGGNMKSHYVSASLTNGPHMNRKLQRLNNNTPNCLQSSSLPHLLNPDNLDQSDALLSESASLSNPSGPPYLCDSPSPFLTLSPSAPPSSSRSRRSRSPPYHYSTNYNSYHPSPTLPSKPSLPHTSTPPSIPPSVSHTENPSEHHSEYPSEHPSLPKITDSNYPSFMSSPNAGFMSGNHTNHLSFHTLSQNCRDNKHIVNLIAASPIAKSADSSASLSNNLNQLDINKFDHHLSSTRSAYYHTSVLQQSSPKKKKRSLPLEEDYFSPTY